MEYNNENLFSIFFRRIKKIENTFISLNCFYNIYFKESLIKNVSYEF